MQGLPLLAVALQGRHICCKWIIDCQQCKQDTAAATWASDRDCLPQLKAHNISIIEPHCKVKRVGCGPLKSWPLVLCTYPSNPQDSPTSPISMPGSQGDEDESMGSPPESSSLSSSYGSPGSDLAELRHLKSQFGQQVILHLQELERKV